MRFLVDASLPRSGTVLLQQMRHEVVDVRDIGMRSATDDVIAAHARCNGQTLVLLPPKRGDQSFRVQSSSVQSNGRTTTRKPMLWKTGLILPRKAQRTPQ
jgi:hypothetical protein